jgi:hypothetical protein
MKTRRPLLFLLLSAILGVLACHPAAFAGQRWLPNANRHRPRRSLNRRSRRAAPRDRDPAGEKARAERQWRPAAQARPDNGHAPTYARESFLSPHTIRRDPAPVGLTPGFRVRAFSPLHRYLFFCALLI